MKKYFIRLWGAPTLQEEERSQALNESLGKQLTELLCYFLIHRGELVSHERLIELFWPESVNPQNALKFAIHRLRKLTQPYAQTKDQEWIVTGKRGYLFSPQAPVDIDLDQLSGLTPALLAEQPRQIEALVRGELMEGIFFDVDPADSGILEGKSQNTDTGSCRHAGSERTGRKRRCG